MQSLHIWFGVDAEVDAVSSTEIAMYFADHNPPHFHVLGRDGAAQVAIETLEVIAMSGKICARRWNGQRRTRRC